MAIQTPPEELLRGTVLLLAPHFDDEILGCGGMLAILPEKQRVHVLFATAGNSLPIAARNARSPAQIGHTRKRESCAALHHLGISAESLHFLDIPEGRLAAEKERVTDGINRLLQAIRPDTILLPFRFDQHTDHLALYEAGRRSAVLHAPHADILEYFVYVHYPLLPRKDIRRYCKPDRLYEINIRIAAEQKKQALNLFTSQTTLFYPDQCRPVLSAELIAEYAEGPEYLLRCPADQHPCTIPAGLLQAVQHLQPQLKRCKERLRFQLSKKKRNNR